MWLFDYMIEYDFFNETLCESRAYGILILKCVMIYHWSKSLDFNSVLKLENYHVVTHIEMNVLC